jgi:hypothetical protein
MSLQLPFGIAPVNPVAVDALSGPYSGVDLPNALANANSGIAAGLRFQSMDVRIIVGGTSYKYWYKDGTDDGDLVEFSAGNNGVRTYVNISGDTTLTTSDDVVFVDSTSNSVDVQLPLASGNGGKQLSVKWISGTGQVQLLSSGVETIDGVSTWGINYIYESISLMSNNSNWYII